MVRILGFSAVPDLRRFAVAFSLASAVMAVMLGLGAKVALSDAEWSVLAVSGKAEWRASAGPGQWQDIEMNGRLPDGAEIRTGGDGAAVVAKGLDRIEVRADTSLVVAVDGAPKGKMAIDQTAGSATYTVEKRPAGTFSVRTAYVVAVVKGTQFTVDINQEETSVSVDEGRVSVSDSRSGESADVEPGQRARASAGAKGLDVATKAAGAKHSNATPNPNPNSNAYASASKRGNSGAAPGQSKEAGSTAEGKGNGGNGNGNGNGNGGGNGNGKSKGSGKDK